MRIDTYTIFIDLVKAYDSAKYDIILLILKKMGALEKYAKWIEKLYSNFNILLKIGREEVIIRYGCKV